MVHNILLLKPRSWHLKEINALVPHDRQCRYNITLWCVHVMFIPISLIPYRLNRVLLWPFNVTSKIKMYLCVYVQFLKFLPDCNQFWVVSTDSMKSLQYHIPCKSVWWEPHLIHAKRWMDVTGALHVYVIVPKIVTGIKVTGLINQFNCMECGVWYVNDDIHEQLQVFQCIYSEIWCTVKTSKREEILKLYNRVAVPVPFACMQLWELDFSKVAW
jgi:hypothetical protein